MRPDSWPLFPDVGVIAVVPDRWKLVWMSRHQVMTRLANYFHVVWCEPAHDWRETLFRHRAETPQGQPSGFEVYRPEFWLPKIHKPRYVAGFLSAKRVRRARAILQRKGCRRTILYIWKYAFARALHEVPYDIACYHIVDEYSFSPVDVPLDERERELIEAVDQVFIHSPGLFEKKGWINPNTEFVPNGVDFSAYSSRHREPQDLAQVPRPRIGYTGWLKSTLDWHLLHSLVACHSNWSFVFVGPEKANAQVKASVNALRQLPNTYFLGGKTVAELPAYPQHFDVCIMPYVINDYVGYIYPLKLHEYLASGRPVIGTPIRSLKQFAHVVLLAEGADRWSCAIRKALGSNLRSPDRCRERREVARHHDWDVIAGRIARTLSRRLQEADARG